MKAAPETCFHSIIGKLWNEISTCSHIPEILTAKYKNFSTKNLGYKMNKNKGRLKEYG